MINTNQNKIAFKFYPLTFLSLYYLSSLETRLTNFSKTLYLSIYQSTSIYLFTTSSFSNYEYLSTNLSIYLLTVSPSFLTVSP